MPTDEPPSLQGPTVLAVLLITGAMAQPYTNCATEAVRIAAANAGFPIDPQTKFIANKRDRTDRTPDCSDHS
jgi:hypothetical protein